MRLSNNHFAKIQLFKEKLSKSQPPGSSQSRDERIALRSVKNQPIDSPTIVNVATRPPPVVIRRKHIPPIEAKQRDSSVAESSVSDEGPRSSREELNSIREREKKARRGYSGRDESRLDEENARGGFEFSLGNDEVCTRSKIGGHSRRKRDFLPRSTSTNGTAKRLVSVEIGGGGGGGGTTSTTSSSSYERDLQSLLHCQPCESITPGSKCRRGAGTSAGRFAIKIGSGSTSSDLQEESELSSEERDALIEEIRTTSSVCRNRIPKFGARRRVVTASGSSVAKDYYSKAAEDRLLGLNEDSRCTATTAVALTRSPNVHVINENVHVINETDTFPDDLPSSSQKPTSAPNTLSLGRKLSSWKKEGKDLLVKSVSSANTLAPTTMTCIKSPRAMSEHLLGQLEVPVAPASAVLSALRVKGGSLRESDRSERVTDVPRQRWSSVRVKGGSTKSLLLENGGPNQQPLKGGLRKEVFSWRPSKRQLYNN